MTIISRSIMPAVVIALLVLVSVQASTVAADQPTVSRLVDAPDAGSGRDSLNWVDDLITALGQYFATNYPSADFSSYRKQLIMVRDALSRHDRQTVTVEMGMFFQSLADRSHGISEPAADELANFGRMVMPVQDYGIFFPLSKYGGMDQVLGDPRGRRRRTEAASSEHVPRSLYP